MILKVMIGQYNQLKNILNIVKYTISRIYINNSVLYKLTYIVNINVFSIFYGNILKFCYNRINAKWNLG